MSSHGLRELLSSEPASPSNQLHSNATPHTQEQALQQALFDVLGINGTQADGLIRNGEVDIRAAARALQQRLETLTQEADASYKDPLGEDDEGRIGPQQVVLDGDSAQGSCSLSQGNLRMESLSNFSSARANTAVYKGAWMFEVTLGTAGIQQLGWATLDCPFNNEEGVGDAPDSYAWDGKRVQRWNVSNAPYGSVWAAGDVIGVCLDLEKGQLSFVKNGVHLGVAFTEVRRFGKGLAYFPALSVSQGEHSSLNFGGTPLRYPQEGFRPLQAPPPPSTTAKAQLLLKALLKLATPQPEPAPGSVPLQPGAPPRGLTPDERTLLAAEVAGHLGPLLCPPHPWRRPHVVVAALLPFLMGLVQADITAGGGAPPSPGCYDAAPGLPGSQLDLAIRGLHASLEEFELHSCLALLWQHLMALARSSLMDPGAPIGSGAYWPLTLAVGLLRCSPMIPACLNRAGWPDPSHEALRPFFEQIEQALHRRQPTSKELRAIMPKVWFQGAEHHPEVKQLDQPGFQAATEEMTSAVILIDKRQMELCTFLHQTRWPKGEVARGLPTLLSAFVLHLIHKNMGMMRNVQPAGLSDSSVLVTTYFALLSLVFPRLRPSLPAGAPAPTAPFDAHRIFTYELCDDPEKCGDGYSGLNRLGGTVSHLVKESPPSSLDLSPVQVPLLPAPPGAPLVPPQDNPPDWEEVSVLVDQALIVYRLGAVSAFKHFHDCAVGLESSLSQLADVRRQIAAVVGGTLPQGRGPDYQKHLQEAQEVYLQDAATATRTGAWLKANLFGYWKPAAMFAVSLHAVRTLLALSARGPLLQYVPELYVESLMDVFQALNLAGVPATQPSYLHLLHPAGLQDVITFVVQHFHDSRIVNPDVREELLQAVAKLLSRGGFLAAFELNEAAKSRLMPSLLAAFDNKSWASITKLLLRLIYGGGFGQPPPGQAEGSSLLFRGLLKDACFSNPEGFAAFLNRLFSTLNWTVTEFVAMIKEVREAGVRGEAVDPQVPRRAALMFDLSIQLARLLEFLAAQLPAAFNRGSSLNLTRLIELLSFILSHTAGPGSQVLEGTLALKLTALRRVSRPALLAPLVGVMARLYQVEHSGQATQLQPLPLASPPPLAPAAQAGAPGGAAAPSDAGQPSAGASSVVVAGDQAGQQAQREEQRQQAQLQQRVNSVTAAMVAADTCPTAALQAAADTDWGAHAAHLKQPAKWYGDADTFRQFVTVVREGREAEAARAERDAADDTEAPDEFLDPLLNTIMQDPVVLPGSKTRVERSTIERHLMSSKTDPFNRSPLTLADIRPDDQLRARIEAWQSARLARG